MYLFANETVTTEVPGFFEQLGTSVGVSLVFILLAVICMPFLWKLIDKITPGDLDKEILGAENKAPNVALAIVVAAFVLGFSIIVAAAIH